MQTQSRSKKFIWVTTALISLLVISNVAWGWMYTEGRSNMQQQIDSANQRAKKSRVNVNINRTKITSKKPVTKQPAEAVKYREIPEFGVKYEVNNQTKDFIYGYAGNNHLVTSTLTLTNSANKCSPSLYADSASSGQGAGAITRYSKSSESIAPGTTVADELNSGNVKKVGDYYYLLRHGNGSSCSESSNKLTAALDVTKAVIQSLQPIN